MTIIRAGVLCIVIGLGVGCASESDEGTVRAEIRESFPPLPQSTITAPTTERPTTTAAPTTTTTELPTVGSGVYAVPTEFAPGTYRVSGYWARLDGAQEIIDNDVITDEGLMILDVQPTDAFVEISGEAAALADMPNIDPILLGFTNGTYLVGPDIAPGQYRINPTSTGSYYARLDAAHEIIDNNVSDGQLIVVVQPSDYALNYKGTLEVMG